MKLLQRLILIGLVGLSPWTMAAEEFLVRTITPLVAPQDRNIVAYFTERQNGKTLSSTQPDPKGTYRALLSKTQEGYWVQDFFQDSHNKQSSPVFITDSKDLDQFQVNSPVGEILIYNRQGQMIQKQVYDQQHNLTYLASYAFNNKMIIEEIYNPNNDQLRTKIWHSNGVQAFDLTSDSALNISKKQVWARNGQEINTPTCFIERSLNINNFQVDPCVLQLRSMTEKYERLLEKQMH